jgi:hypothetical protein
MTAAEKADLPFTSINPSMISAKFEGMTYSVKAVTGVFSRPNSETTFRISPSNDSIILNLAGAK